MTRNEEHMVAAQRIIPWGTQTNAKRHHADMGPAMPGFIERAKGCRMWDLDGREYIDFRCSLGPTILGYTYDEVDDAVREQMAKGSLFSMASPIELEVAQAIHEMVPGAEMVRFMKTGADANMCCVRIARAYTGRERLVICGYHGYHDYFMVGQQNNGVPQCVRDLVDRVGYRDVDALRAIFAERGERIGAMLMEPYNWGEDLSGDFVREARRLTEQHGALLIFDEVLTGFRLAKGGAQEYFGVTPDLASYAKALANGYPLSAYTGKREFMMRLYDFVLTTTYAGETISLAAAKATLGIMRREPVHEHLYAMGTRLMQGMREVGAASGVEVIAVGSPVHPQIALSLDDAERRGKLTTAWQRELYAHGVFPGWFLNYSHQPSDVDETVDKASVAMTCALKAVG